MRSSDVMIFFDTHVHVQDPALASSLEAVMGRARAAGVRRMLCCGTCEADWGVVADLARRYPDLVLPAFGLHPMAIADRSADWLDILKRLLDEWPGAPIGEIGLDRAIEPRNDEDQESVFRAQLEWSRKSNRPVLVHGRRVTERLQRLLNEGGRHPAGIVLHSFHGPVETLPGYVALNAYFSFSGSVTWPNARRVHAAVRAVPLDRLLLETDAPCIRVASESGGPDSVPEPADIVRVAQAVARLRETPLSEIAEAAWTASEFLFRTVGNADRNPKRELRTLNAQHPTLNNRNHSAEFQRSKFNVQCWKFVLSAFPPFGKMTLPIVQPLEN